MTTFQILSLFGIPSILTLIFTGAIGVVHTRLKDARSETAAVKLGVQALLRAQLVNDYNKWSPKGYAPIYARENFENVWNQYHALGANGVMDDLHEKFLDLPTEKPKEVKQNED